jgi:uncharacterized protein YjbI with pentapeptide repeats
MKGKSKKKEVNGMAKKEQLAILRQGPKVWNEWRESNFDLEIDLSEADLSNADLRRANLSYANLSKASFIAANLSKANLSYAKLHFADFSYAKLHFAKLRSANLSSSDLNFSDLRSANLSFSDLNYADLSSSNLNSAKLSSSDLRFAILRFATLSETDFQQAKVYSTIFGNLDLSAAKGLDTLMHLGPSTIGIDTIYRSKGKIPKSFLRGCGVPDTFITFMHSLTQDAIQYYSCFISYSTKDQECAERLYSDLQNKGVRCWFAPEDLKIGDRFQERIEESIRIYDKLLLILSDNSVSSPWVEREVQAGFERENKQQRTMLFPITLDDSVMESTKAWAADIRRTRHIGDFRNWKDHDSYQKAFSRLLRDLKASEKEG